MIILYSGTPGSGKSLHAARTICNWARSGSPIIANFPCNLSRYKKADFQFIDNSDLTPEFLIEYAQSKHQNKSKFKEDSILLIIDECQLLFNAREWQKNGRSQWLSFFTQHRKYGYKIILIAQFDRMIDRQIRSVIEYEYIHRKMSNFGAWGKILSLFFGGNSFIAVKRYYPLNEKIGSEIFHVRKRFYSIYDSYATFGTSEAGGTGAPAVPGSESDKGIDNLSSDCVLEQKNDVAANGCSADQAAESGKELC